MPFPETELQAYTKSVAAGPRRRDRYAHTLTTEAGAGDGDVDGRPDGRVPGEPVTADDDALTGVRAVALGCPFVLQDNVVDATSKTPSVLINATTRSASTTTIAGNVTSTGAPVQVNNS